MITFENAQKCHRRMWNWLAETGEKHKCIWPEFKEKNSHGKVVKRPLAECFACEIVQFDCKICPMDWAPIKYRCKSYAKSPYMKWKYSITTKARKKYAAIIRDLPWTRRQND